MHSGYLVLFAMVGTAWCDYKCICNYIVERDVHSLPSNDSGLLGNLYEFDCKPFMSQDAGWYSIAFEHKLGYVEQGDRLQIQTCPGNYPDADKVTNSSSSSSLSMSNSTFPTSSNSFTMDATVSSIDPTSQTTLITTSLSNSTLLASSNSYTNGATVSFVDPTIQTSLISSPSAKSTLLTSSNSYTNDTTISSVDPSVLTSNITSSSSVPLVSTDATNSASATTTHTSTIRVTQGALKACEQLTHKSSTVFAKDNFCYELVTHHQTFDVAERECVRRGGHLAHIQSLEEQKFLTTIIQHYVGDSYIWIGLQDTGREEHFEWTSGETLSFTYWYPYRKDFLLHGLEDCVAMRTHNFVKVFDGEWEDLPCSRAHTYICQFDIRSGVNIIG